MNLYEFKAKHIFREYGIKSPPSRLVSSPSEALKASKKIGLPVVIKAQILEGGREKAGLIRMADNESETLKQAKDLLWESGKAKNVEKILVEKKIFLKREYYLGITIDELATQPVLIFGSVGGVDIEEVSKEKPESISKLHIDPWKGISKPQMESFLDKIPLEKPIKDKLGSICERLTQLFLDKDCLLAEINPLGFSREGGFIALDAKFVIDDNALFRHLDFKDMEGESSDIPLENEGNRRGFSYVKLNGDIGLISHGAGIGMLTVDMIENAGGSAANFLDIKGHEREKNKLQDTRVKNEMDLVLSDTRVKAILFNVFGGLTRCDEVAMGIRNYLREHKIEIPIVVRLSGTRSEKVHEILEGENVILVDNLDEAVKKVVRLSKENTEDGNLSR